jgi:ribose transport system substrate-binding protein
MLAPTPREATAMRSKWLGVLVLWALGTAVLSGGCQQQKATPGGPSATATPAPQAPGAGPEKIVRIGIVTNAVAPFWTPMEKGMRDAAARLPGCEASWQGPQTSRVAEQRRLIENYVAQGVDGLAISPLEAKAIGPVIDELIDKGINVICIDSDIPTCKRLAYIGTNNLKAGEAIGRELVKILNGQPAKVVAFVGTMSAQNARERLEGFKRAVAGHQIEVVDVKQDNTDKGKARRNVEDTLQAMPEVNVLLGLWSYNLPAIAAAVKEAGKRDKIVVVGFDAEPATLQGLKNGDIDATVVQKPYYFGYLAVMLLYQMARCGAQAVQMTLPQPNHVIDTGVEVVTPQTVDDFVERLHKIGVESS